MPFVLLLGLVPALLLFWRAAADRLGANPAEALSRATGWWALVFLCLCLSMSPLRRLSGWSWPIRRRRMLGLYCFFYACLHALAWMWFDQGLDPGEMWRDVVKRPFITIGMLAFLLLWPLALTSTQRMKRRMGRAWMRLHRVVHGIAGLALLHYTWHKAGKNDFGEVSVFALVIALLMAERMWRAWERRRRTQDAFDQIADPR